MQRLSAQDASFLHIEDDVNHMHIGSVAIFEGPPPTYDEILSAVSGKLPLLPRYRQKVRFVPLNLGRPVWVCDPHFNLTYHVRHTALPEPGSDDQLRRLVGRVMSQQLDRAKPLWEMWVAEGLSEGRWALVSKVHHCMVDGVSGSDLLAVMLDKEREPGPPAPDSWRPEPEPSDVEVVAQSLAERVGDPLEVARGLLGAARSPRAALTGLEQNARAVLALRNVLGRTPASSLNGPIGPHRRWAWAHSRLSDVKVVRTGLGGTVNDVVLTAITNGFRELIGARGESLEGRFVRTLVPVSVRSEHERGTYNNRVSAMFAELPVCVADPVERLRRVREQMAGLKDSRQAVGGEVLTSLTGFAPALLLALGTRVVSTMASRVPHRGLNTVTTNVPGPQFPLYTSGRRMLEAFPYVPLASPVRVAIAIFSYDGGLNFGVTGDYDSAPDIDVLCRGIESGLAELVAIAKEAPEPARARGPEPAGTRPTAAPK